MLSDKRKERLISEMQNLEKSIFDEVPYSIFDDIRRYIVLNLGLKKKNIEHELEKMKI